MWDDHVILHTFLFSKDPGLYRISQIKTLVQSYNEMAILLNHQIRVVKCRQIT